MKKTIALLMCVFFLQALLCSCSKEEDKGPLADSAKIYYSYSIEPMEIGEGELLNELLYMFASMETEVSEEAVIDIADSFNVNFYLDGKTVAVFYVDSKLVFSDGSHNCYVLKDGNYFDYGRLCEIYDELNSAKNEDGK
jgi:hypothetical protein